jgi:endothelin-converting enzyme/putative endopeptidase
MSPLRTLAAAAVALGLHMPLATAAEPALPYTPGLDPAAMDRTVDPCVDFYQYACGGWKARNPIPPDQTSWSVFAKLAEDNMVILRSVLEQAAAAPTRDAVTRQIGDYYAACMDEAAIDAQGAAPLAEDLAAIAQLKSTRQMAALLARLQAETAGASLLFNAGSQQDPEDSSRQIAGFSQGGLGLPERDHYFRTDAKSVETRERYRQHLAKLLMLLGEPEAEARAHAGDVLRLETALAGASLKRVQLRDPYATKHKMPLKALMMLAPGLDWRAYLAALNPPRLGTVNVAQPAFFKKLSRLLQTEPLPVWQSYLRAHLANQRASALSAPFVSENFAFYRQYLGGAKQMQPRWKRCVRDVDAQLGEALGQAFVQQVFKPETRAATLAMVQRIEAVMARRIQARDWMSEPTKAAALTKLRAVRNKIGYPERWRDYSAIAISRSDHAGNVRRAAAFESARDLRKIGQPVDRGEWGMTPPTVNAYFDPQMNDINFPAGVLQPPLYDPLMDDAPNYGNTGGTIAHELTHGFDDEGRQFDDKGNLRDWWQKADAKRFAEKAKCISDQYSAYEVVDGLKINGALTLGEDVADLGGQVLAYQAWQEAVAGMTLPERDGLQPDQRFFVGFAQWACSNIRPEQARELLLTDPHSPDRFRINGVVVNMPEFARAFACKPGSPMTKPRERLCSIW